jgi:hypothetical protein
VESHRGLWDCQHTASCAQQSPEAYQGLVVPKRSWTPAPVGCTLPVMRREPTEHAAAVGCRFASTVEADTKEPKSQRLMQSSAMHRRHESFGSARLHFSMALDFPLAAFPFREHSPSSRGLQWLFPESHSFRSRRGDSSNPATVWPAKRPRRFQSSSAFVVKMAPCLRSVPGAEGCLHHSRLPRWSRLAPLVKDNPHTAAGS